MTRLRRVNVGRLAVASLVLVASWVGISMETHALNSAAGAGSSASRALVMLQAATPSTGVTGTSASTSWTATQLSPGVNATRYTVRRYTVAGTLLATLTNCATGGATSCVDSGLPNGNYKYTVAAGFQSWNGSESAFGNTVTVGLAATFTITSSTTITALPSVVTGTIANYTNGASLTYRLDSPTGTVLSGTPATVTNPTSQSVSVTLPTGVTDGAHSIFVIGSGGSEASALITVAVPPQLQSLVMQDVDGNGKVDRVVATFNEALAAYTAGTAPWTLANVPSAGTLAGVAVSGSQATLTITEGAGAADTAVGSFTIALAVNTNGIRDAAGNRSSFAATAPSDQSRPVAMTITDTNGIVDGQIEAADTMSIVFSEPLNAATVPTTTTITMTGGPTSAADLMTLSGVSGVDRSLGGTDYISKPIKFATFANSPVVLANGNRTITIIVGTTCTNDCKEIGTQLTAAIYSFLPVTTIADPAGNTSTAVRNVSIRLF